MEKVNLKTNYFQFWVDWDQLLFCDFWDFFRRCKKKPEKVRLNKKWKKLVFKSIIFDLASIETNFFRDFFVD